MTVEQKDRLDVPKRVFVISPIGGPDSPERQRADRFLKYIVQAALPSPQYEVERADQHDSPHAITAAMLSSIVDSHICVADITGRNPNVFYELALAHAMDKHVVIMDGDKDRSPFDIQDQRAIKYGLMPEEIEAAVAQLKAKAVAGNAPSAFKDMMNPVATAFRAWTTQQRVETSGDSTEQMLLRVVERLEEKVDRFGRQPGADESIWQGRNETEYALLAARAERSLRQIEKGVTSGALHPSLDEVVTGGRNVIKTVQRGDSLKGLRMFLEDAEYILSQSSSGEQVTVTDLPSQKRLYPDGEATRSSGDN